MAFESLLNFTRIQGIAMLRRSENSEENHIDALLQGGIGGIYDEMTFRHFLALERSRAALGERPCVVLLVSLRQQQLGQQQLGQQQMPRTVARALFTGLEEALRDVDFIGWYRKGRIAGAVLPQGGHDEPADVALRGIAHRVSMTLNRRVPSSLLPRLRVRVFRLGQRRD